MLKPKKPKLSIPIGLPDQVGDLPTAPVDRGDETQDRFRYQWAMGVVLLAEGISGNSQITSIWCEHHEDFLVELDTGNFIAIQIKTTSQENAKWKLSDEALIKSITRFCALEESCGAQIDQYHFASNAPAYVPGPTTKSSAVLSSSPLRLIAVCSKAVNPSGIHEPYKAALNRPGFRGGCLVKVKPGFRSSRRVADSSLPQPRPVEYTQSAPAVGGG